MSKLVKFAGQIGGTRGGWSRYLWHSMRHNERACDRYVAKTRERLRGGYTQSAASYAMTALAYARSANAERRMLGL